MFLETWIGNDLTKRAQLPNCLGGGSTSYSLLSPQFLLNPLFTTWFFSIQLFWGYFATARQVTLAGREGGLWLEAREGTAAAAHAPVYPEHHAPKPSRPILPTFQVYFLNFSSVFYLPFHVFLLFIIHPSSNVAQNTWQPHQITILSNCVIFSHIFEIFSYEFMIINIC